MRIDGLQYVNWSEKIFRQMRKGGVDAVHVTISYHETFRETVLNFEQWNRWFEQYSELIMRGTTAADIDLARASHRTAIFFGFQNPSPIEDDIGLIEIMHMLGARFMQLCDAHDIPLLFLCDTPGIMVGPQAEHEANARVPALRRTLLRYLARSA